MIGGWLYRLTPRDQQQAQLEHVLLRTSGTLLSTTVLINAQVPSNKIFILKSALAFSTGGVGQNLTDMDIEILAAPGAPSVLIANLNNNATRFATLAVAPNDLLVPPGGLIQSVGVFSAGALANTMTLCLAGNFIPRGEVGFSSF